MALLDILTLTKKSHFLSSQICFAIRFRTLPSGVKLKDVLPTSQTSASEGRKCYQGIPQRLASSYLLHGFAVHAWLTSPLGTQGSWPLGQRSRTSPDWDRGCSGDFPGLKNVLEQRRAFLSVGYIPQPLGCRPRLVIFWLFNFGY